jgi:hypothetical protein
VNNPRTNFFKERTGIQSHNQEGSSSAEDMS